MQSFQDNFIALYELAISSNSNVIPTFIKEANSESQDYKVDELSFLLQNFSINEQNFDTQTALQIVVQVRELMNKGCNVVNELIEKGFLSFLSLCLQSDDPNLQYNAASIFTDLATGPSTQIQAILKSGGVEHLIKLVSSENVQVSGMAVWALGNINSQQSGIRDYCVEMGAVSGLSKCVHPNTPLELLVKVSWALNNLCHFNDYGLPRKYTETLMDSLSMLIQHKNEIILRNSAWAISSLAQEGNEAIQMVIERDILQFIVPLLSINNTDIQKAALRTVGNLTLGSDEQTQIVIDTGFLQIFPNLFQIDNEDIQKEILWIISNVTAGNREQIQAVVDANLLPLIVSSLSHNTHRIKNEAAWAASNMIINGSKSQVEQLLKLNPIPAFCAILSENDKQLKYLILDTISNILKMFHERLEEICEKLNESNGVELIKQHMDHEDEEINRLACSIIDDYLEENDDDVEKNDD